MNLLDAAVSIVDRVTDKLDPSKQIERAGQRSALAGVAAGIGATGAVFLTLAGFMGLRQVVDPAIAALICGVALICVAALVMLVGRAILRRQEQARDAAEASRKAEDFTAIARQVGEVAGGAARNNAGALVAAAFAFGLVKGLGPKKGDGND